MEKNKNVDIEVIPRFRFGVQKLTRNNVEYASENELVYACGNHFVKYNLDTKQMEFVNGTTGIVSVSALAVSGNGEYIVAAEKHHIVKKNEDGVTFDSHFISLYKSQGLVKVRSYASSAANNVISMAFSNDGKNFVTLDEGEHSCLTYWNCSANKPIASIGVSNKVTRCFISAWNNNLVSTSGEKHLKCWQVVKHDLKMINVLPSLRDEQFVDHVWFGKYLATSCNDGTVHVFTANDGLQAFSLVQSFRMTLLDGELVITLARYQKGFLASASQGSICLYESTDISSQPFKETKSIAGNGIALLSISMCPGYAVLAALTSLGQIVQMALENIENLSATTLKADNLFNMQQHSGQILCMDISTHRPVLLAGSKDQIISLWNFKTKSCEFSFQVDQAPICVALHPTGYQILVSTKEQVYLYNILHDDLRLCKNFLIKRCLSIAYAHGGHLFACSVGNSIQVYRSYSNDMVYSLKGHTSDISQIVWSNDDKALYSAGRDGILNGWDMWKGTRMDATHHVVKQSEHTALAVDKSGQIIVAGTDGILRRIKTGEELYKKSIGTERIVSKLCLSHCGEFLFAATMNGLLLLFSWPLNGPAIQEINVQAQAITDLKISADGRKLFCASEDSTISILMVRIKHDSGQKTMDKPQNNEFVLIAHDDVEDIKIQQADLRVKYEQVKSDTDFAIHRQETEWIERVRTTKEEMEKHLLSERQRYDILQTEYEETTAKHTESLNSKEESHMNIAQEMENQYEHKLAMEMSRNDILSEEAEAMRQRCDTLLENQEEHHLGLIQHERNQYKKCIDEQAKVIQQLHDDLKYNQVKFEEVLSQQEKEYEHELKLEKERAKTAIREETSRTTMKQGQLTAVMNKYEAIKKKLQEVKANSHSRDILLATEKAKTTKLEETLSHFEQHVDEREVSLANKEKSILSLRAENRTLDNFRYVLDHRVHQLQQEKEPIQGHVEKLEGLIRDMREELLGEYQRKVKFEADLENKDIKIKFLTNEVKSLRNNIRDKEHFISQLTREISRIVKMNHPKDIEDAVRDAYKLYVKGEKPREKVRLAGHDNSTSDGSEDYGAVQESVRQINFLQHSISTLQNTVKAQKKDSEKQRRTSLAQNSALISECNELRKANKELQLKSQELLSMRDMKSLQPMPSESKARPKSRSGSINAITKMPRASTSHGARLTPSKSIRGSKFPVGGMIAATNQQSSVAKRKQFVSLSSNTNLESTLKSKTLTASAFIRLPSTMMYNEDIGT